MQRVIWLVVGALALLVVYMLLTVPTPDKPM
jgi:hypothetical protein